MNFVYSILFGVLGVLIAKVHSKTKHDKLFWVRTLSKIGIKYRRCTCHNGLEQVLGESYGTFGPEFHTYPCRKCKGSLYVLKKEKK